MAEAMDGIGSGGTLNEQPGLFIPPMQRVHGSDLIPAQPFVMNDGRQVMPVAPLAVYSSAAHQAFEALYTTDDGRFKSRTHYPRGGLQSAAATTARSGTASQESDRPLLLSELQARERQARELQALENIALDQHAREQYAREQMAQELQARELRARELRARELQARELQARELQALENIALDQHAREQHAREQMAQELQARELRARELRARELRARELRARELLARELQARELQARELQAREQHAREQHAREQHAREQHAREQHAPGQHAPGQHAPGQMAQEQQTQEQQTQEQQTQEQQTQEQQTQEQQTQEQQTQEQQTQEQQTQEQQTQEQQTQEQQTQEQQTQEQQTQEQQTQEQQTQEQQTQEQQTLEQHREEKLSLNYSQQLTFQAVLNANRCPENIQQGSFVPQSLPQTLTRTVPEDQKNDAYWKKRNKDKLYSKKRREGKRIHEHKTKLKVTHVEENAKLRKKLAMLKKRHGLPENQSIMTPEERRLCEIEKKSFVKRTEARLGCREEDMTGHVSTTVKKEVKKNTARPPKTASSDVDASVPDGRPDVSRGPSTPAPFIPPQSWPPVARQPFFGSMPVQNYHPRAGPSSSVGSELREGTVPFNILDRGVDGFIAPYYDVYMQYISQGYQMIQRACDYVSRCDGLPPAALNDSQGRHDQRGLFTGSSGGALNVRHGNTEVLPANVAQSAGSRDYVNYMGHAAAMLPPPQVYDQFDGHFKVPLPVNPFRRRNSQRSETAPSDGKDRFKNHLE